MIDYFLYVATRLLIILFVFVLNSCNGLGFVDTSDKPIQRHVLKDLPGTWNATEATYKTLKEKNYKIDSIRLILKADSTFELINTPDCINDPFGNAKNHLLAATTGTWEIEQATKHLYLLMTFNEGKIFETKMTMNFAIYSVDSILSIVWYMGDPDQADVLMFKKKQ